MTMGEQHIVRSFDEELNRLEQALARMCGLAESQLAAAMTALAERDSDLASRVMTDDRLVDETEDFVGEQTIRLLALRSPVADDLRVVVTALKVAGDIERIADHIANTAKRTLVLNQAQTLPPIRSVTRLIRVVQTILSETFAAYLTRDAERAVAARGRDEEVDALYSSLFREILTYMIEDPRTITLCSHLLFAAKNIERIGDHATNIAEMTYYMVTGRRLTEERVKRDDTSLEGGAPVPVAPAP